MQLNFKEILIYLFKAIIIITFITCLILLGVIDYQLGIKFCNFINVPIDFTFSSYTPGLAIEFSIILFVFEVIGLGYIFSFINNNIRKPLRCI